MQVRIEKLVYGGRGLARTDSGVVFVDGVVPGEQVEIEVTERRKDFARARLVEVLEAAEARQAPVCPNFHAAGCCDWSHIRPAEQIRIKEGILRESLERLGGIRWDAPIASLTGPTEGYRMRASFHVAGLEPAFMREGSREPVPIQSCAALMPELNAFLKEAAAALGEGRFGPVDSIRAIASPSTGEVSAVFLRGRRRTKWGAAKLIAEVSGIRYNLRPSGFFQPNRYTLELIQKRVAVPGREARVVLDLFSGDGFFSLPLARSAERVIAVDRRSTLNAQRNARLNRIGNVDFVKRPAHAFLRSRPAGPKPDLVVLDPPRSGAGSGLTRAVSALVAPRIVYVSCNPSTLAADARILTETGYRLESVEPIDQFPNTHHVEVIASFER
jgi:23S rRNA (uracil1939-C5)-methyltransferase